MSTYIINALALIAVYGILTLSLNLQYGTAGLLNFGQAIFFAVGAYAVAIAHFHGLPVWFGLLAAPIAGGVVGAAVALPARRLDGKYWALLTLGVAELFLVVVRNEKWIAGGSSGTRGIASIESWQLLLILVAISVLLVLAFERLRRSQFGRVIRTMREDPILVRTFGRDLSYFQIMVMAIGGATGAIAGAALAHSITFVAPDIFPLHETLLVWIMLIVGGLGNNVGALLGAFLVQGLFAASRLVSIPYLTAEQASLSRLIVISIAFIVILIVKPRGALPEKPVRYGT